MSVACSRKSLQFSLCALVSSLVYCRNGQKTIILPPVCFIGPPSAAAVFTHSHSSLVSFDIILI